MRSFLHLLKKIEINLSLYWAGVNDGVLSLHHDPLLRTSHIHIAAKRTLLTRRSNLRSGGGWRISSRSNHSGKQPLSIRIVLDFNHDLVLLGYVAPDNVRVVQNIQIDLNRICAVVRKCNEYIRVEIVVFRLF